MFLDYNTIFLFILSLFLGLSINLWFSYFKYESSDSIHQRFVSIMLPPSVLVITWVISSNLALSLGMIGALSIVRFRNPVKSPLELVIYFLYIVIGVSVGVNYKYSILIWILALASPIIIYLINKIFYKLPNTRSVLSKQFIVYVNIEIDLFKVMDLFKKLNIELLSSGSDEFNKKAINLSFIIDNKNEYLNIKSELEKNGKILNENIQITS